MTDIVEDDDDKLIVETEGASAEDEASKAFAAQLKAASDTADAATRRAETEREARLKAEDEAKRYQTEAKTHQTASITTAIDNVQRDLDSAKGQYERYMEAGEYGKAAQASADIAMAATKLAQLEARGTEEPTRALPATEQARTTLDPMELYLSQFSAKSQSWLRLHPDCVTDTAKNAAMMSAHYEAQSRKIAPESPEYFALIEEKTGYRQPVSAAAEVEPARNERPRVPVSAAPSREVPAQQQRNPTKVRLSKEQQEAAAISGISNEQYAANLIALTNEGKIGRTSH